MAETPERSVKDILDESDGGPFGFHGPVPEAAIVAAERELGLRFPPSYRRFLGDHGAGMLHRFDIHGLFPGPELGPDETPMYMSVVDQTTSDR